MSAGTVRPAGARVGTGIVVSGVLHVAALGAFLTAGRAPAPRPAPPVYRVDLVAAPPGPARLGDPAPGPGATPEPATAARPSATPPLPSPAPARPKPAPAKPIASTSTPQKLAPKPARVATPASPSRPSAPSPAKPEPTKPATAKTEPAKAARPQGAPSPASPAGAGGAPSTRPPATSPAGGAGRDPATVRTPGLQFPYPGYLANIVRQVRLRFDPGARGGLLQADVAFLIRRDGSVAEIRVVRASGSYTFDLEAQGAVEAAGAARAFGPLPDGFRDDVLPVTFSFDPRVLR